MKQQSNKLLILIALVIAIFHTGYSQLISRITMQPMKVVYVADTVKTMDSISSKMGKDYGTLFMFIGKSQLKPGKLMAIYHTSEAPWIFDVAVEVDRLPGKLMGNVQFKNTDSGDAVVLHFRGPYEQLDKAYLQIEDWLNKNGKLKAGAPIEVYLNNPSAVKDKNELLTDIYQLIK
jgi:effector-binding domain-containing protein